MLNRIGYFFKRQLTQIIGVYLAVYFGLKDIIIGLLKNKQALDFKDRDGRTPLLYAAINRYKAVVELLLARDGVDVNSKDSYYG